MMNIRMELTVFWPLIQPTDVQPLIPITCKAQGLAALEIAIRRHVDP